MSSQDVWLCLRLVIQSASERLSVKYSIPINAAYVNFFHVYEKSLSTSEVKFDKKHSSSVRYTAYV